MRSVDMARDYATRARRCLREAELAFSEGDAAITIRRSQEALELVSKALLRLLGIEYPRTHDVGDVLVDCADRFPEEIKERVDEIAKLSSELAAVRGPAFYGYEGKGITASQAFSLDYARQVLTKVRDHFTIIYATIENYIDSNKSRCG